jgi:uncharacterized protein
MAKNGFKLLDSDMHIIEPPDLWQRYIDPAFKAQAPRGWPGPENPSVLEVAGKVMPRIAATPPGPPTRPCMRARRTATDVPLSRTTTPGPSSRR